MCRCSLVSADTQMMDVESSSDLPTLRLRQAGNHAHGRLPVLLRVSQLQDAAAPQSWGLLRVLLVRFSEVPADPTAARMLRVGDANPHLEQASVETNADIVARGVTFYDCRDKSGRSGSDGTVSGRPMCRIRTGTGSRSRAVAGRWGGTSCGHDRSFTRQVAPVVWLMSDGALKAAAYG